MLSFDTSDYGQNYKFLIGSILPRPIALVATLNEDGSNNLAPFSFFTAVSAKPMIVAFSPLVRGSTGQIKDTPRNILRTREFVVNIFSENLSRQVNLCSQELPYGEDEFNVAELTPLDSETVAPRRVGQAPVHFECRLRDHLDYGHTVGAGQIITGEVLRIHVHPSVYQDGRIVTSKLKPVGRGAGSDWFRCTDGFQMQRFMKPPK